MVIRNKWLRVLDCMNMKNINKYIYDGFSIKDFAICNPIAIIQNFLK